MNPLQRHELSSGEVIDQTKRVLNIASWKIRLILDNLAALGYQTQLGLLHVRDRYFEDRPKSGTSLDE
jgi:hypothetical protein